MMAATGCDGVVVGRGCLGRPWLFGDLVTLLNGGAAPDPRALGVVVEAMRRHARLLAATTRRTAASRSRCATSASTPTGTCPDIQSAPRCGARLSQVSTLVELDAILDRLDPTMAMVADGERIKRGHTNGPIKVSLPEHFLDDRDELTIPDDNDVMMSGELTSHGCGRPEAPIAGRRAITRWTADAVGTPRSVRP